MQIDGGSYEGCGGSANDAQYCEVPALPDGPHTAKTRCIVRNESGSEQTYENTFAFAVDGTPPTLRVTKPLEGSVQPVVGFHAEGASDGVSIELNLFAPGRPAIVRTISSSSGVWSVDLPSATMATIIDAVAPLTTVQLALTASDGLNSTTTIIGFYLDGIGPSLSILSPNGSGGLNNFSAISGIASDISGVDRVEIAIQDTTSGLYWSTGTRKFDSTQVVTGVIPTDATVKDSDVGWSYGGLTDRYLQSEHTYFVSATAVDTHENRTTASFSSYFSRSSTKTVLDPLGFGGQGSAIFDPINVTITWGGLDFRDICVRFTGNITEKENWQNRVRAASEDGVVTLHDENMGSTPLPSFGGFCGSDQMRLRARSLPTSCLRQGTIRVYFDGAVIGEAAVVINAPHRTFASLIYPKLGVGTDPKSECKIANGVDPPCRYDGWHLVVDEPFQSADSGAMYFEDLRGFTPLVRNGVRVKMCPIAWVHPETKAASLPLHEDFSGYDGSLIPSFKNCGEMTRQGLTFISSHNLTNVNPENPPGCEFVNGIVKTKFMDGSANLTTTRSDATNNNQSP